MSRREAPPAARRKLLAEETVLEIVFIIWLTRRLARVAEQRGHSKGWGALGAIFWIAGEIIGLVIGFALELDMGAYGLALLGAGAGATLAYAIVANLGSRPNAFELAAAGEPIGRFDPHNPYSPPGTYPSA
jgi:hypothetical protein